MRFRFAESQSRPPRLGQVSVVDWGAWLSWLERLLYTQDVGGSIPSAPRKPSRKRWFFFAEGIEGVALRSSPDSMRTTSGRDAKDGVESATPGQER